MKVNISTTYHLHSDSSSIPIPKRSSYFPLSQYTWRKIIIGSASTANLGAVASFIYGWISRENIYMYLGSVGGVVITGAAVALHKYIVENDEAIDPFPINNHKLISITKVYAQSGTSV